MLEVVFVLAPTQNQFFFELAAAIRHELDALGVRTSLTTSGFPEAVQDRAYILLPPHEYFVLEGNTCRPDPALLQRTVFICCEQPESPHFLDNLALAPSAGAVFDINRRAIRAFAHKGVAAEHLRIGYTPHWDHFENGNSRPIDVAFLGAYTERRARVLGRCADSLWRYRCQLHLSDNSRPNTAAAPSFVAEDRKWSLLTRAKTLLNVHQGDEPYFEWLRVVEAIHGGCVVASEASSDYPPLIPGAHLVMARRDSLGLIVPELLEDAQRLADIRTCAYTFLRDELPMRGHVARLAAAAEKVAARPVTRCAADQRRRPTPARASGLPEPSPYAATQDPEASAIRGAFKDLQLQLLDLRRDVSVINLALERGSPPALASLDATSAAYRAQRHPRVTVITPLYNHEAEVAAALDSVVANRFKDLEIVVVNDGSTDGSGEATRDWIARHDHVPVALVSHPVNRGLPRTRNTALDFARGELMLVLDSDNVLMPHCVERLVGALDGDPEASFAYGILDVFDQDGPCRLVSQFEWEPRRLRPGNYIDALALIRSAVLREVGGYTTDSRLHGVEDWDLWATLADRGHRGLLVREIVAGYRLSPTSMTSLVGLSTTAMHSAMIERHPDLMRGVEPPL